jgi:hypothetical protein
MNTLALLLAVVGTSLRFPPAAFHLATAVDRLQSHFEGMLS